MICTALIYSLPVLTWIDTIKKKKIAFGNVMMRVEMIFSPVLQAIFAGTVRILKHVHAVSIIIHGNIYVIFKFYSVEFTWLTLQASFGHYPARVLFFLH